VESRRPPRCEMGYGCPLAAKSDYLSRVESVGSDPLPGHFDPGIRGCFKSDNRRLGTFQGGRRGFCANARALGAGLRA
jgi:hypothetical protein